jgi:anaerobic glycerol-3-phosphate dehydrogenase
MNGDVRSCDVLVVGRGAAGCIAAIRLAEAGARVILIGRETTATALSTGRIDLTGTENEASLSSTLRTLGVGHGLYQAPPGPMEAITNGGTIARQSLRSTHDWCGPLEGSTAVVGLKGDPDLDPILVCSALKRAAPHRRFNPYRVDRALPCSIPSGKGADLGEEARAAVDLLTGVLVGLGEDRVVLPPLFAGPNYERALSSLERASGRKVVEPMTPLSNPGGRLQACLEKGATTAGCTLWKERALMGLEVRGSTAAQVVLRSGLREVTVRPRAVVLATGNLAGGGLTVDRREVIDPLGLFALEPAPGRELASLPLTRALSLGIRNVEGKVVLLDGTLLDNVVVTGSAVPGLSYPLGKGLGQVMADAWTRAEMVLEVL